MIKLDLQAVLYEALALVDEVGHYHRYVNPSGEVAEEGKTSFLSCYYVHNEKDNVPLDAPEPGCIIGKILFRLGVPLAEMAKSETSSSDLLDYLSRSGVIEKPTPKVYLALATMQRCQDLGTTWHTARQVAIAAVNGINDYMHKED
jgi:hypothetical protein